MFDTSGDGLVDFREFMTTLHVSTRGSEDEKLEWAFNVYDVDKSIKMALFYRRRF